MGSLLMDIADGDLFNLFSEEWAMKMEMGLENEAESVGCDGRQDGFLTKTAPNLLGTEPPESTDPIETMMGAYGIAPLSPQSQPPSRHGQPPSRHGYPPSRHGYPPPQPKQPTRPCSTSPCSTLPIPCSTNPCLTSPCSTSPCSTSPCSTSPCSTSPCSTNPCSTSPCSTSPCSTKKGSGMYQISVLSSFHMINMSPITC